jgi:hypothetical protein
MKLLLIWIGLCPSGFLADQAECVFIYQNNYTGLSGKYPYARYLDFLAMHFLILLDRL